MLLDVRTTLLALAVMLGRRRGAGRGFGRVAVGFLEILEDLGGFLCTFQRANHVSSPVQRDERPSERSARTYLLVLGRDARVVRRSLVAANDMGVVLSPSHTVSFSLPRRERSGTHLLGDHVPLLVALDNLVSLDLELVSHLVFFGVGAECVRGVRRERKRRVSENERFGMRESCWDLRRLRTCARFTLAH
jgi:hypothetical protein